MRKTIPIENRHGNPEAEVNIGPEAQEVELEVQVQAGIEVEVLSERPKAKKETEGVIVEIHIKVKEKGVLVKGVEAQVNIEAEVGNADIVLKGGGIKMTTLIRGLRNRIPGLKVPTIMCTSQLALCTVFKRTIKNPLPL